MKFGLELRLYNQNNIGSGYASGNYTFNKTWTQQNAQRADANSGNEFDLILCLGLIAHTGQRPELPTHLAGMLSG